MMVSVAAARADDAARDRRIDEAPAGRQHARRDCFDRARRAGRHQHDDAVLRRGASSAPPANRMASACAALTTISTRTSAPRAASAAERGARRRRPAPRQSTAAGRMSKPRTVKPRAREVSGHGQAHGSEADEADRRHRRTAFSCDSQPS